MTRDEIMNMPAGRKMDALVAEKVMGLKVDYEFNEILEPRVPFLVDKYDEWGYLPNYSTDIAAALQVVEKMYSIPEDVHDAFLRYAAMNCPTSNIDAPGVIGWWFAISNKEQAICRAALLAIGELVTA